MDTVVSRKWLVNLYVLLALFSGIIALHVSNNYIKIGYIVVGTVWLIETLIEIIRIISFKLKGDKNV